MKNITKAVILGAFLAAPFAVSAQVSPGAERELQRLNDKRELETTQSTRPDVGLPAAPAIAPASDRALQTLSDKLERERTTSNPAETRGPVGRPPNPSPADRQLQRLSDEGDRQDGNVSTEPLVR